jgi:hypothetical protein
MSRCRTSATSGRAAASDTHHRVAADATEGLVELRPVAPGIERRVMDFPDQADDVESLLHETEPAPDRVEPWPEGVGQPLAHDRDSLRVGRLERAAAQKGNAVERKELRTDAESAELHVQDRRTRRV